jgi:hypothetical protein
MTTQNYIAVRVTDEDIKNGMRCSPCMCPVSLAITRVTGHGTRVGITRAIVNAIGTKDEYTHRLSPETTKFIKDFDGARPVESFVAELIPLEENT